MATDWNKQSAISGWTNATIGTIAIGAMLWLGLRHPNQAGAQASGAATMVNSQSIPVWAWVAASLYLLGVVGAAILHFMASRGPSSPRTKYEAELAASVADSDREITKLKTQLNQQKRALEDQRINGPQLIMEFPHGIRRTGSEDHDFWLLKNIGLRPALNIKIQQTVIGEYRIEFDDINGLAPSASARVRYKAYYSKGFFAASHAELPNPSYGLKTALGANQTLVGEDGELGTDFPFTVTCTDIDRTVCTKQIIKYEGLSESIAVRTEVC